MHAGCTEVRLVARQRSKARQLAPAELTPSGVHKGWCHTRMQRMMDFPKEGRPIAFTSCVQACLSHPCLACDQTTCPSPCAAPERSTSERVPLMHSEASFLPLVAPGHHITQPRAAQFQCPRHCPQPRPPACSPTAARQGTLRGSSRACPHTVQIPTTGLISGSESDGGQVTSRRYQEY